MVRLVLARWTSDASHLLSPSPLLISLRPGVAAIRSGGRPHEAFMEIPIEEDPFDYEIFMVAKRIFATRLIEYGIRVPQDLL